MQSYEINRNSTDIIDATKLKKSLVTLKNSKLK